ncbi:FAD:protein FMN transferase [Clostridium cylindrosporum]|uniref:FAD:protein FMN transferase n=1 Tax=Clostridium cylindrosporum DSM 605 TaxID=1121307 RepID=A0A0J8DCG7_CLOCY|nr:FAD:protein FMN transferase [Clostridium cylindrosporum]KMT21948.1 thiamine biosynthesis lipoprotein ApbE [Clostridium cylindrosporum DSM 605]
MERTFIAFGTMNTIAIQDDISKDILDEAVDIALKLDDKLSVFKANSEVSLINKNAGIRLVEVSEETLMLIEKAVYFSEITEGAFDITIRPGVKLWNIGKVESRERYRFRIWNVLCKHVIPKISRLRRIQSLVNYRDIRISKDKCQVMLSKRGQGIDLGGIAKGYAADKIKRYLISKGVKHTLINLGGNVMAIGGRRDGEAFKVGIQNPLGLRGEMIGFIELNDLSLVTSGVNERFFIKDGHRYHHILDPKTLSPTNSLLSVSLKGECSMELDALTTALFVIGYEKGMDLVQRLGLEALFILDDKRVFATKDFANMKI